MLIACQGKSDPIPSNYEINRVLQCNWYYPIASSDITKDDIYNTPDAVIDHIDKNERGYDLCLQRNKGE